jgi:hypothetical protein
MTGSSAEESPPIRRKTIMPMSEYECEHALAWEEQ